MKKNIYEKKIFLFNCNCKSANIKQQTTTRSLRCKHDCPFFPQFKKLK